MKLFNILKEPLGESQDLTLPKLFEKRRKKREASKREKEQKRIQDRRKKLFQLKSAQEKPKVGTPAKDTKFKNILRGIATVAYITFLEKYLERKTPPAEPEPLGDEVDIIIQNFKDLVNSMIEDDYSLRGSHSFSSTRRTASGGNAKQWSAEQIVGYGQEIGGVLGEAIENVGKEQVAKNIQTYGTTLVELAEQIVFAIYENRYAKWGGGRGAYYSSLQLEIKSILETKAI